MLGIRLDGSPVIARKPDTRAQPGPSQVYCCRTPGSARAGRCTTRLGEGFTLLARRPGAASGAIERAARARGVPLRVLERPGPDPAQGGPALALVRPDRYVRGPATVRPVTPWP